MSAHIKCKWSGILIFYAASLTFQSVLLLVLRLNIVSNKFFLELILRTLSFYQPTYFFYDLSFMKFLTG